MHGLYCTAQIQFFIAKRRLETARCWLAIWKQVDPDHGNIERVERMLNAGPLSNTLARLFGGWRRRHAKHREASGSHPKFESDTAQQEMETNVVARASRELVAIALQPVRA